MNVRYKHELCKLYSVLYNKFKWWFFLGVVALFTLPKVYETNKAQIDQNLALVQSKINELTAK